MARITVLGGTGYAGAALVREAAARGHEVRSISRNAPAEAVPGVAHETGDVADPATLDAVVTGTDVVVTAVPPRGPLEGALEGLLANLARRARAAGVRLGVIGGAGSLQVAPGGPKLLDTDAFPAPFLPEAQEMDRVLETLRASPEDLDWFYVSPAVGFGAYAPGEARGTFRVGGDVLLADDAGRSELSAPDLATAIVDEIERPTHRRARFTVAY